MKEDEDINEKKLQLNVKTRRPGGGLNVRERSIRRGR